MVEVEQQQLQKKNCKESKKITCSSDSPNGQNILIIKE